MNGATMLKEGIYKIVPQAAAVRGNVTPQLGSSQRALPPGFSVQIVPLHYVGTRDMLRILEPFAKDASAIRADELRNLVILSGTERELRHLMETIDMFDIDWMAGMSAGVFTLQNADVKSVMAELEKVIGRPQPSPLAGIMRVVPIERMNALLVISPNPQYLEEAKKWIERLDGAVAATDRASTSTPSRTARGEGRTLAAAGIYGTSDEPDDAGTAHRGPRYACGHDRARRRRSRRSQPLLRRRRPQRCGRTATPRARVPRTASGIVRNLQAVADKDNNTIIIVATPGEYSIIEPALKKLDTPSRQVIIEMTIAEVTLTDQI